MKTIITLSIIISLLLISTLSAFEKQRYFKGFDSYKFFYIDSSSMEPSIKKGSIVLSKKDKNFMIGDILVFQNPIEKGKYIAHRYIKDDEYESLIVTKGDNNNDVDPWLLDNEMVYGKIFFSLPLIGYFIDFTQKPLGMLIVFIIPLGYLMLNDINTLILSIKTSKSNKMKKSDNLNPWVLNDSVNSISSIDPYASEIKQYTGINKLIKKNVNWRIQSVNKF